MLAAYATTIRNGCLTGADVAGTAGVYAYSTGGPLSVLVENTSLADWDYGLYADGAAVTLDASTNSITSNVTAGYDNTAGGGAQDAEHNWWGAASGPGGTGPGTGDAVLGAGVDFTPWLVTGTDTQPGCGFDVGPDNVVTPGPVATCVSIGNPCVTVPVNIARTTSENLRGFSVDFTLSGNLALCGAGITEGTYLSAIGLTNFLVVDNGGGSYTVDAAILGLPCGATAASGLLFEIPVSSASPGGTGTVTINSVIARDCDNLSIAASPGAPLAITIDNVAPTGIAALAAAQVKVGNDGDGTTKVNVSWPAVEAGATVEVYRAGFGNYPEYDDAPGAGSVPATPGYPPGAPWALAASVSGVTAIADEVTTRDFWYYAAFVKDACGNVSPVSNQTTGTLNYHLGDVHNTIANCAGDNQVSTSDISFLGANYAISLGASDPLACLDVGPTTDISVNGRPTTDNRVQFEDLILFAINYGVVAAPASAARPVASAPDELGLDAPIAGADGRTLVVPVRMRAAGGVQGLSLRLAWNPAAVEPMAVESGELLRSQSGPAVAWSAEPGGVDVAVFGTGRTLVGEGELARVAFRIVGAGAPGIALAAVDARGPGNERLALGTPDVPPASSPPARTELGIMAPNPFRDATSVHLSLREAGRVRLAVFDLVGRRVRVLHDGPMAAGPQAVRWDGRDDRGAALAPGNYVMQLEAGEVMQSRAVRLVR
jgi:hypothetical protein